MAAVNQKRVGGTSSLTQELMAIETNLEQLANKRRKILDVYELDGMDRDTLSMRLEELAEETSRLHARKSEIEYDIGGDACQEVSLELVRELLGRLDGAIEKASPEQRKAMLHLAVGEINLTEDKKIGKIVLTFDDKLQKYFMQEDPSANVADGSLARSGVGKGRFLLLSIAI